MSELKSFNCVESDLQDFCEPRLVYLKSEADREILRQKHKRCLAMAELCQEKRERRLGLLTKRGAFYHRWFRKWLSLANKFKDAK